MRVKTKFLARLSDDYQSVEFKSLSPDEREMLLATMPDVFHMPPNYHGAGVFARLATLNEATLRALLEQRWRRIAPKQASAGSA